MLRQPSEDLRRLRRSLPFPKNYLGHARTQRAMMVDFRKAEVFKGQVAKAIDGGVGCKVASAHLLEKFADGFGVHRRLLD